MNDDIRLLVLNCEYPPIGGGAATATACLLREFERFPVKTTLVTASTDDRFHSESPSPKCRIDYVPVGKRDLHYWTNRELVAYVLKTLKHLKHLAAQEETFDLCHAFFTLPAGAVAYARAARVPYVISLRGSDVPGFSGRYSLLYRAAGFAFASIWRRAAAVVANSRSLKDLAAATAPKIAIEVIPNGVDTAAFFPAEFRATPSNILVVARLIPRKDVDTALRAFARLHAAFPGVRLTIVGDGPQAPFLKSLAGTLSVSSHVDFRLSVPREQMGDVYRSADIFMMTSMREGMSNTVLEALASGLPLVVSPQALAGIEAPGARLVNPADVPAAADALSAFLSDESLRKSAAKASRAAAMAFTWQNSAAQYVKLYRAVLAAPPARSS